MNKELRVWFCDFWPYFNPNDNYFIHVLEKNYVLFIDELNPELVIFSVFGFKHLSYFDAIRVQFIGENIRPNYWESDFSLSFDYEDYSNRNLRMPLYVIYGGIDLLLAKPSNRNLIDIKPKFCNMVVSNPNAKFRNIFFNELSKYKFVDSGGEHYNNIGYRVSNKIDFIKEFRFSISFENSSHPGYTTEKIYESMIAGSIPIYWGNSEISKEFNEKSFLNVHRYSNIMEVIEHLLELDSNVELYKDIYIQPWLLPEQKRNYFNEDKLLDFFSNYVLKLRPFVHNNLHRKKNSCIHICY